MDFLYIHISYWWGFLLGALFIGIEFFLPTSIFLWTGISCILVSVLMLWTPSINLMGALGAWIVISLGSIWMNKSYHSGHPNAAEGGVASRVAKQKGVDVLGMSATLQKDSIQGLTQVN